MLVDKLKYLCFLVLISSSFYAQNSINDFLKPSDSLNISRRNVVVISESALSGFALIGLNQLWYADYERSNFQLVNDNNEWLQMDKIGHAFSSYHMGKFSADLLDWSGVSEKNQLIYGATLGFVFLTSVEVLDGFSKEWGFSLGDIIANGLGTGLYMGQELLWHEQRMVLKYSFHQTKYANLSPDKLGATTIEQVLKDYNGQTYWLSVNLYAFFKDSKLPKWLNLAIGYGAEGMLTARFNPNENLLVNQVPYRQYYLSLDVDLESIKTNSRTLKSIFSVLNMIKIPFPAFEFNKNGAKFHLLYN